MDDDLDRLASQQKARQTELDRLSGEVATARESLAATEGEVAFAKCEAEFAEIKSEVMLSLALCLEKHAVYEGCLAQQESRKAHNSILGAVLAAGLALGLAPFTGGGSLVALGAAGAGAIAGDGAYAGSCVQPKLTCQGDQLLQHALIKRGLSRLPKCSHPTMGAR
ncbi:MAG: hypothetical protein ACYCWW_07205 [Deltaproteobacteria bacterium]